jgi:hypothetical protein
VLIRVQLTSGGGNFELADGGLSYIDDSGNVAAVNNFITFHEPLGFAALESKDLFDSNDFHKRRISSVRRAVVPPTATSAWCATVRILSRGASTALAECTQQSSSNDDPFAPYTLSLNSSPDVFFICSSDQILSYGQPDGVSGCQNVLLIASIQDGNRDSDPTEI